MHIHSRDSLPRVFCWSRIGTEAGEPLRQIVARKEAERVACGGIFYWGIGSAVGRGVAALLTEVEAPEVLFSPIKGAPRVTDVSPSHVARWGAGRGLFGERVVLPAAATVTSRWDPSRPATPRYALVCSSLSPLDLGDHGELRFDQLRNLCSGAPVGASQVTAVIRRLHGSGDSEGRSYTVALRVSLVSPYVLRLTDPEPTALPVECADRLPTDPSDRQLVAQEVSEL